MTKWLKIKMIKCQVIEYTTAVATLKDQAGRTLDKRVAIVQGKFNLPGFHVYHLRQLYRLNRISLQRIRAMKQKVDRYVQQGFDPIYLDEIMFTNSTILTKTGAPMCNAVEVERQKPNQMTIAVIAAISALNGVELVMQFDRSVDKFKFEAFLAALRDTLGKRKLVLVLDNLSVHRCKYI